jgi:uncharacterized HAD superfamily protein
MPGALIISKYLSSNGINHIHRITSRPRRLRENTIAWYKEKMPWVDRDLIHIQTDRDEINPGFKIEQIKDLKIDLFFEDSVKHAETISVKTKAAVILIPQPSNAYYKPDSGNRIIVVPEDFYTFQPAFFRAYSWLARIFG